MSVIVTGAAGAMGAAIVRDFVEQGKRVIAQDVREIGAIGEGVVAVEGDLRDRLCLERLRGEVETSGLEAVIAAHGTFAGSGPLEKLERESTQRLMEINFSVIPRLLDALLEPLGRRRGVVVVIASQAALRGEPSNSVYSASKWALRAWAEAMDARLREQSGVRVRTICPGRTLSPLLNDALDNFARVEGITREEYEQRCFSLIPARRFGKPEEIAAAVRFLVAPAPRPNVLAIDGGEVPW